MIDMFLAEAKAASKLAKPNGASLLLVFCPGLILFQLVLNDGGKGKVFVFSPVRPLAVCPRFRTTLSI